MQALRNWLLPLFILIAHCSGAQTGPLLRSAYTPAKSRGTVGFFLEDISQRAGIAISYGDELLKRRRTIRLRGSEHTIEEVLRTILAGTRLTPVERNGKILLVPDAGGAREPRNVTISGFVRDSASREVLIGAVVYVPALGIGTTTNTYGFYSLSIPAGTWKVIASSFGYTADSTRLTAAGDLRRDVLLPYRISLAGVTVSSQKTALPDHAHLSLKDIKGHAGLLGENDVMRALQYLPGVQSGSEGSSTILVRGGDPGHGRPGTPPCPSGSAERHWCPGRRPAAPFAPGAA